MIVFPNLSRQTQLLGYWERIIFGIEAFSMDLAGNGGDRLR